MTTPCLSRLRLSRLALGELSGELREQCEAHLALCASCAASLADEHASIAAAAYERVPAALLEAAARQAPHRPRRGPLPVLGVLFGSLSLAGIAVLLVLPGASGPGQESPHRSKGTVELELAIQRDGGLLAEDVPASRAPPLLPGDRLRLRVVGAASASWVRLEGDDAGTWRTFFEGALPEGGFIPHGLSITEEGETRVRLSSCPEPPSTDAGGAPRCATRVYTFQLQGGGG